MKIAVVFGGKSAEHEVSVITALQAINALDKKKYDIIPIYISKKGEWYSSNSLLKLENYKNLDKLLEKCQKLLPSLNADDHVLFRYPYSFMMLKKTFTDINVALPMIHGTYGEDGTLQGIFEMMNIPYGGSNVLSSAIGMDKIMMKAIFRSLGFSVLADISFFSQEWITNAEEIIERIENQFSYPVIVKPADLGSSIGIKKVKNISQLRETIDNATLFSRKVIVERAIVHLKEINCSVLGDYQDSAVSVCEEPITDRNELLSFQEKYIHQETSKGMAGVKRKIPADISIEDTKKIQEMAKKAFQILDCSGVARIDFLIDKNTEIIYINEINTIPGSLSFYLWQKNGKSFQQLMDEIISLAQKKYREKNNLKFSFESNIFDMKGEKITGKF